MIASESVDSSAGVRYIESVYISESRLQQNMPATHLVSVTFSHFRPV